MRYIMESRVRYSETDHRETLTLPALINYFQDCSTFQSQDIGLGVDVLKARQKAWVLSYWQVVVDRYPGMGEKIIIGTQATSFRGMFGNRNFYIEDEQGKRLACANSIWVFMDTEKGRPVRPGAEDIEPYGREEPLEMEYEDRKIRLPESKTAGEPFSVRKYHIDTNEHVNNCQYVQMALEMLPGDIQVHQLRVDYKKSAVLGDVIYPYLAEEADRTVVELCGEDGKAYAVIELK